MKNATTASRGTPPELFSYAAWRFGPFDLDVCAEPWNAKCLEYFTEAVDGLDRGWAPQRCWMNPPYERGALDRWLLKAASEATRGAVVCALIPTDPSTRWWQSKVPLATDLVLLTPRGKFQKPDGTYETGAKFGSALALFTPAGGPPRLHHANWTVID